MSKYNQKPFTAEEKRKAIDVYSEKIQYSARYASEFSLSFPFASNTPKLCSKNEPGANHSGRIDEDWEYRCVFHIYLFRNLLIIVM